MEKNHQELLVGDKVEIKTQTLSGKPCIEGTATIREIQDVDADRMLALVEFDNEPGKNYFRIIWTE